MPMYHCVSDPLSFCMEHTLMKLFATIVDHIYTRCLSLHFSKHSPLCVFTHCIYAVGAARMCICTGICDPKIAVLYLINIVAKANLVLAL